MPGLTNTFSDQHLFCVFSDQKSKQILQEGTHFPYFFFFVFLSTTKVLLSLKLPEVNTQLTLELNSPQMCQRYENFHFRIVLSFPDVL